MAQLVDQFGRPVKTSALGKEIAAPSMMELRSPWFESVANGLTPEDLGTILNQVDQGDITAYLTLAEEMEERDLHFHSVLGTRKLAVSGLEVMVESASDSSHDSKISEYIEELVAEEHFDNLISDQLDALNKGFSVSEIIWDRSEDLWRPADYIWRDQRHFQFDRDTGQELRLRDEADTQNGLALEPFKFVQHRPRIKTGLPIRGGLARLVAVAYMCKSYTIKDWLSFVEVFGMPLRVGKFATGANREAKAALLNAVASIGADASCIIPAEMEIEFIRGTSDTSGGDEVFQVFADWFDSQVSKGVLGQTMTTDDGSSMSQAKVHDEVRKDILAHDAKQLASTLRRDVIKPAVDLNFGVQPRGRYPTVRLVIEEPEDLEMLSKSLPPMVGIGMRVEESWARDKFGIPEPADDAVLLGAPKEVAPVVEQPDDGDEDEPADPIAEAREKVVVELLHRVRDGAVLTDDQRTVVCQAEEDHNDGIEDITDNALDDWQRVMDPILMPLIELAESSETQAEFTDGLDTAIASMDTNAVTRDLAIRLFEARGLGNVKDEV